MAIARGTKASGGTDFVTGFTILADEMNTDLNTIVSGVNNITISDSNVVAGANIDPSKIGDYSADATEYVATAAPISRDATNFLTITQSRPTDLEGELSRIRYVFKEAFGRHMSDLGVLTAGEWYDLYGKGSIGFTTGDMLPCLNGTAKTGWVLANDGTIGNGSSNGTTRANADTRELFALLWNRYSATLPILDSAGSASTYGADAATDYAANKAIRLPYLVGRSIAVAGTPNASNRVVSITGTQGITGITPRAGSSTTVFFISPSDASFVDTDFVGMTIRFTSGALSGTEQAISAYIADQTADNLPGHRVTVGAAFGGTPISGVSYVIFSKTTTQFVLPWDTAATKDDVYNGWTLETTGGTGSGQTATITDYDASQRQLIFGAITAMDHTTTFALYKTLTTRANLASVGSEDAIPTLSTLAVHDHTLRQAYQGNTTDHDNAAVVGTGPDDTVDEIESQPVLNTGSGSTYSLYQPTVFVPWQIKL